MPRRIPFKYRRCRPPPIAHFKSTHLPQVFAAIVKMPLVSPLEYAKLERLTPVKLKHIFSGKFFLPRTRRGKAPMGSAMLVCQCNIISSDEILATIHSLLAEDAWQLITPLQVYHLMNKRGRCCGCFPDVVDLIVEATQSWHRKNDTPHADVIDFITRLRSEHERIARQQAEARARLRTARAAASRTA